MHIELTDRGRSFGKVLWKLLLIAAAWLALSHWYRTYSANRAMGRASTHTARVQSAPKPAPRPKDEKPWYHETMLRPSAGTGSSRQDKALPPMTGTHFEPGEPMNDEDERPSNQALIAEIEAYEERRKEQVKREPTGAHQADEQKVIDANPAVSSRHEGYRHSGGTSARAVFVYPVSKQRSNGSEPQREKAYRERESDPRPGQQNPEQERRASQTPPAKPPPSESSRSRPASNPRIDLPQVVPPKSGASKAKTDAPKAKAEEPTTKKPAPPVRSNMPASKPPEKSQSAPKAPPPTKAPAASPKNDSTNKAPTKVNPGKAGATARPPAPKPAPAPARGKRTK